MTHPISRRYSVAIVFGGFLFLLSACSSTAPITSESQTPAPSNEARIIRPDDASDRPSTARLEELFEARQDSARMRFTQADVDFMTGMIGHHAQALIMSRMAPTHGAGEQILTLTARIDNAQQDEIATMQKWLGDRGQPVPEVHLEGLQVMLHGVEAHHAHMPGMLTDEQMQELDAARGLEFDRLFLKYMIQHHQGAVVMVDELFSTDGAGQDEAAFKLAGDIHADQTTEIRRMELMLEARTDNNP